MIRRIWAILSSIYRKIRLKYELYKYDDYSIENMFRKQGAQIGKDNRIMVRSLGESPYLVEIGNHCTITSDVAFLTHDGGGWIFNAELASLSKFGKITIRDNCFIAIERQLCQM